MIQQYLDDHGYHIETEQVPSRENGFYSYRISIYNKDKLCDLDVLFRNRMLRVPAFISMIESRLYEKQLKEYFGDKMYSQIFKICTQV